jgi:hypothetical protein
MPTPDTCASISHRERGKVLTASYVDTASSEKRGTYAHRQS